MKSVLRVLTFVLISTGLTQALLGPYSYGKYALKSYILFVLALTLLFLFLRPILKIVSLPSAGLGYMFMSFVLTSAVVYILMVTVPDFVVKTAGFHNLNLFGFVVPSTSFEGIWAVFVSSAALSLFYAYFEWICDR